MLTMRKCGNPNRFRDAITTARLTGMQLCNFNLYIYAGSFNQLIIQHQPMLANEGRTDEELLHLLQNGDEQALTWLYRRHWEPLFLAAYQVLKDKEACKDLVQELFTEVWQKCNHIQLTGSFKAYLAASIRYKVFRYIRQHPAQEALFEQLTERMQTPSPESELAVKELQALLNTLVAKLPEKCATIYRMSREQHLSYKEIATRLNVSVKTVENQINIALRRLRTGLHYSIGLLLVLAKLLF